jgi:O-antigen/teichoic acid export membrane protein
MSTHIEALLSGRLIARNTIWNLAGMAAPLLVAVAAVPYLIEGMGKERFGMLAIIWMGIGYFSLFDMGLGLALTKLVAEHLGQNEIEMLHGLIWTALWLIIGLGVVAMVVVFSFSSSLMAVLNVPEDLRSESIAAFRILALGLPVVTLTTAFVGILEAHQRFASIALLRAILGTMTFLAPVMTLQITRSLAAATAALLCARSVALVLYYLLASKSRPELLRPIRPHRVWFAPLFTFGGWLTVTNIISPIMVYFDRFFIANLLTLAAVAYYVTPYEVLSRGFIFPGALMSVLFPALVTAFVADNARMKALYSHASRGLLLLMLPPVAVIFLLAPEGLSLWLGEDFRKASTIVVHWLAVGVIINTLARVPFFALQSAGRPDLVAKIHLAELLPYIGLLSLLTKNYGIAGTAAAWTIRITADTVLLLWFARKTIPEISAEISRTFIMISIIAIAFFFASAIEPLYARVLIALSVCVLCGFLIFPILRRLAFTCTQDAVI